MSNIGIGIDFGTTNSVASIYDKSIRKVRPLLTAEHTPHPSVVWYRADGSITVGIEAKRQINSFANIEGNEFISSIKRQLGKNKTISVFGENKYPSDVSTEVFRHLKKDAEQNNCSITEAVVTVPIYFDGKARRDLRNAADAAGIFIKTFIHEPFAAVVGYYHRGKAALEIDRMEDHLLLVFDWGGGTLDITLTQVVNGEITELATGGLNDKAGDHFDGKLTRYAKAGFIEALKVSPDDITLLPGNIDRLLAECERAKKSLSEKDSEAINVAQFCQYHGTLHHLKQSIRRNEFEQLIAEDIKEALSEVNRVLESANVKAREVDVALLIGGSSRIPKIRERLREMFGHRMVEIDNADTVIAEGAAIIDAEGMQPVLSRPLCVELSDGTMYEIFKAGDIAKPEACRKTISFYCTDNRDGQAKLVLAEGIDRKNSVRTHKTKEILPIPVCSDLPQPYNHERVTAHFALDENMVLQVSGKGATQNNGATCAIFDLCFGLRLGNNI